MKKTTLFMTLFTVAATCCANGTRAQSGDRPGPRFESYGRAGLVMTSLDPLLSIRVTSLDGSGLQVRVDGGFPDDLVAVAIGSEAAAHPVGPDASLLVGGNALWVTGRFDANGSFSMPLDLSSMTVGAPLYLQAFHAISASSGGGVSLSAGLKITAAPARRVDAPSDRTARASADAMSAPPRG